MKRSALTLILVACGDNEQLETTCGNWEAGGLVVIDDNVYWTDDNAGDGSIAVAVGFVWRQPIAGGEKTKLATLTGYPDRMTHDAHALYVAGGCGGGVWKVPLDGSPATMIAQVTDDECVHGIAVDETFVYFTTGGVHKLPLDGGSIEQLVAPQDGGDGCADDIVVGADRAYWASGCYDTLSSVPLAGGAATVVENDSVAQIGAAGYGAVAADDASVFWAGQGKISSIPLGGSLISTVAQASDVGSIAVDETRVYWTTGDGVFAAPRDGNGPTVRLADATEGSLHGSYGPGLAVDDSHVYWSAGCVPERAAK